MLADTRMALVTVDAHHQPIVQIMDGEPLADSRDVAAYFGKQHKNVLRDIRAMSCSAEFRRLNFELREDFQEHSTGSAKSTYYTMTKDGFLFLALGFNGHTAGRLKEAYIA